MSSPPRCTSFSTSPMSPAFMTERSNPAESALSLPTRHTALASAVARSSAACRSSISAWLTALTLPSSIFTTATPSSMVVVTVRSAAVREVLLVALGDLEVLGIPVEDRLHLRPRLLPLERDVLGRPVRVLLRPVVLQHAAGDRGLVDLVGAV